MPCYCKIILKSWILCIYEDILKSFGRQECNSRTDLCNHIGSIPNWRNEGLCVYIYMLNASVVANTFLHMRLCMIRLKCLQFDCQCSKKSSPKREKQSLPCTTVSNQLVRKVNLAGMLYLYLLVKSGFADVPSERRQGLILWGKHSSRSSGQLCGSTAMAEAWD